MNLLDTIGLFGTVALAAPIGLLGAEFLAGGRTFLGAGFLTVAVGLVAGMYFRPSLSGTVADKLLGRVPADPEEDTD